MIALPVLGVLVFMVALMAVAWTTVVRTKNAGWIDVFWTFGSGAAGAACALLPMPGRSWPAPRQALVAGLVAVWALRLGSYIAMRVGRSENEDVRYVGLREEWGAAFDARIFWLMQVQAPATALLCLSILVAAHRPSTEALRPLDLVGSAILLIAIAGEGLADRQMKAFKADPANHGKVVTAGLWGWSRHPNYFFEWLGWLAYPVIAVDLSGRYPAGWLAFTAPVLMYLVLTRLTGVPPLEAALVRSKGEAYRAYQARTSVFFPAPPSTRTLP